MNKWYAIGYFHVSTDGFSISGEINFGCCFHGFIPHFENDKIDK